MCVCGSASAWEQRFLNLAHIFLWRTASPVLHPHHQVVLGRRPKSEFGLGFLITMEGTKYLSECNFTDFFLFQLVRALSFVKKIRFTTRQCPWKFFETTAASGGVGGSCAADWGQAEVAQLRVRAPTSCCSLAGALTAPASTRVRMRVVPSAPRVPVP